jgi:hypothetical protein
MRFLQKNVQFLNRKEKKCFLQRCSVWTKCWKILKIFTITIIQGALKLNTKVFLLNPWMSFSNILLKYVKKKIFPKIAKLAEIFLFLSLKQFFPEEWELIVYCYLNSFFSLTHEVCDCLNNCSEAIKVDGKVQGIFFFVMQWFKLYAQ